MLADQGSSRRKTKQQQCSFHRWSLTSKDTLPLFCSPGGHVRTCRLLISLATLVTFYPCRDRWKVPSLVRLRSQFSISNPQRRIQFPKGEGWITVTWKEQLHTVSHRYTKRDKKLRILSVYSPPSIPLNPFMSWQLWLVTESLLQSFNNVRFPHVIHNITYVSLRVYIPEGNVAKWTTKSSQQGPILHGHQALRMLWNRKNTNTKMRSNERGWGRGKAPEYGNTWFSRCSKSMIWFTFQF